MRARACVHKIIIKRFTRFQRRLRQHWNTVLGGRRIQSMPVQKCFDIQTVFDPHLKPFPKHHGKSISALAVRDAENLGRAAVNLNNS